ncbi:MAG: hypothetical protein DRI71_05870 [Bacteroidetes bacterium]|nr:MAG: hypothetical protein DRI71_05870 [Bacteroidota bacterium]
MNYKNANKCHKCPQNNTEKGCPHWMEITMTSDTGEFKTDKACGHVLMPKLLIMTVNAANRTTEQASGIQNEITNGFKILAASNSIELPNGSRIPIISDT